MARIVYGVQGDVLGDVSRTLALAEEMPRHEFLFLDRGKVPGGIGGCDGSIVREHGFQKPAG